MPRPGLPGRGIMFAPHKKRPTSRRQALSIPSCCRGSARRSGASGSGRFVPVWGILPI